MTSSKNPDTRKAAYRRRALKKRGMTTADYDDRLADQDGRRGICDELPEEDGRSLALDHNHATDQNRGLLCTRCNLLLGFANDSLERLQAATNYLIYWSEP